MKKKQLIYILDGLKVSTFSAIFYFWVKYSFKNTDGKSKSHVMNQRVVAFPQSEVNTNT